WFRRRETAPRSQSLAQAHHQACGRLSGEQSNRTHGYLFVTKDRDVAELAILRGAPPKVIWLRMGNCSAAYVERTLRLNRDAIARFVGDPESVVLELVE